MFDEVFVLVVDVDTLNRRLDGRRDNPTGKDPEERALILRLHATEADLPPGATRLDATVPLVQVVDEILRRTEVPERALP